MGMLDRVLRTEPDAGNPIFHACGSSKNGCIESRPLFTSTLQNTSLTINNVVYAVNVLNSPTLITLYTNPGNQNGAVWQETVRDQVFTSCEFINNWKDGIDLNDGASDITIANSVFQNNSEASSGSYSDIVMAGGLMSMMRSSTAVTT